MGEQRPYVDTPPGPRQLVSAAAGAAATHWDLPPPELVRTGMNGIFIAGATVLRVSRPTAPAVAALGLAGVLEGIGVRVARPLRREPFDAGGGLVVTAWERLHAVEGLTVDWRAVGAMVAAVHHLDPCTIAAIHPLPACEAFPWWDFDVALADVDDLLDEPARGGIRAAIDRHHDWHRRAAASGQPDVVCHGDVHPGNVVATAAGPVLIDWDLLCRAPAAWDHAPLRSVTERWGGTTQWYADFAAGYGELPDPVGVVASIAELRLAAATLMRMRAGRDDERARIESERRLCYWRGDPDAPQWEAQ